MTKQSREFTLSGYLDVIKRQRLLILAVAIVCAGVALALSFVQKKTYEATASLVVNDPNHDLALLGGSFVSTQTALQLASATAPQVTRPAVVARVRQRLHSRLSADALRGKVQTSIDPNSYVINVTATDRSAAGAAALANAFATADQALTTLQTRAQFRLQAAAVQRQLNHIPKSQLGQQVQTVETLARLKNLSTVSTPLQLNASASVPSSPSSPKPVRNGIAALIFGLLLGLAIAVLRDALDRRLRHSSDVTQVLDHPVVGLIRSNALGHAGPNGAPARNGRGPLSAPDEESFRILQQNVRYLATAADTRTLLVTSAMAEEGKSTVAACLAVANAEAGRRTLLVECDLRRPVLAKRFAINPTPGLTDYLTGNAEPTEVLQPVAGHSARTNGNGATGGADVTNLVCITSGTNVPQPAKLLSSDRFRSFLEEVSKVYDSVILDTAPVLPVADTLSIIPDVATLLVCVRLERTTRDQAAGGAFGTVPAARPAGGTRAHRCAGERGRLLLRQLRGRDDRNARVVSRREPDPAGASRSGGSAAAQARGPAHPALGRACGWHPRDGEQQTRDDIQVLVGHLVVEHAVDQPHNESDAERDRSIALSRPHALTRRRRRRAEGEERHERDQPTGREQLEVDVVGVGDHGEPDPLERPRPIWVQATPAAAERWVSLSDVLVEDPSRTWRRISLPTRVNISTPMNTMPTTGTSTGSDGRRRGTSTIVAVTAIRAAMVPARDPEAYTPPISVADRRVRRAWHGTTVQTTGSPSESRSRTSVRGSSTARSSRPSG